MKHRILALAIVPALGLSLLGVNIASAHGFGYGFGGMKHATPEEIASKHQTMFEQQAQLLGITVDEVKNAWAEGKTIQDIITEKGITQDQIQARMQALQAQQLKTQLQTLVDKGIITQAQADKRLQTTQTKLVKKQEKETNKFFKRIGKGFWF